MHAEADLATPPARLLHDIVSEPFPLGGLLVATHAPSAVKISVPKCFQHVFCLGRCCELLSTIDASSIPKLLTTCATPFTHSELSL